nr:unnamed protein product [Callosobruchus chinensis]
MGSSNNMKCYLFILVILLVVVATSGWKNATTRKKASESGSSIFSATKNTRKSQNVSLHTPVVKSGDITTTKGKGLTLLNKKHKVTASNPKEKTVQNSSLDRRFVTNNKNNNSAEGKSVLDKRNIAVTKEDDTKSHTTTVEAKNITTARIEYKLLKKPHNLFIGRAEGEESYPTYSSGGVGQNFVEFDVLTQYGKGFKVFAQIFGYRKEEVGRTVEQDENEDNNTIVDSVEQK